MTDIVKTDEISANLIAEIKHMVEATRGSLAKSINSELTLLNWRVGDRIGRETLKGDRAQYGERILSTLSQELSREFGRGFSYSSLTRMVKFAQVFPKYENVATLSQQLSWSHFQTILPFEDSLKREFYAEMCRLERWSVRTLRAKIDSLLYERTGISKQPEELARKEIKGLREGDHLTPALVFRDPYVLDFLQLSDTFSERDLEAAILRELERFLLELGVGFTFVARQKRMVIDEEDFYLDLLFYHRKLRRLIAVELKIGKFKAAYKGQLELYLRWLAKHEAEEEEESPLGLILCTEGSKEQIELLELDKSGIHVAEYLTVLPPREVLESKLKAAVETARAQLASRGVENSE